MNTLAIAEREIKSFFVSSIAWIIAAAFMAMCGFLFAVILLNSNEASMRFLISNLSVILLFVAPFLTMRLLSEEIRLGTVELLLTNPVRDLDVVFGKFLGAMGFVLVMLALTLYFPALLFVFGSPDPGPIVTGYLACSSRRRRSSPSAWPSPPPPRIRSWRHSWRLRST